MKRIPDIQKDEELAECIRNDLLSIFGSKGIRVSKISIDMDSDPGILHIMVSVGSNGSCSISIGSDA